MKNYYEFDHQNADAEVLDAEIIKPGKKTGTGKKILVTALCCGLLGGALGAGGTVLGMKTFGGGTSSGSVTLYTGSHGETAGSASVVNTSTVNTGKLMTAAEVYKANVNSTVGIRTSITGTNYWGYQTQAAASGSGFIISAFGRRRRSSDRQSPRRADILADTRRSQRT